MKELRIGNLVAKVPVIQGGMGVGISLSSLAGAVAAAGGIGVLSAAQIGYKEEDYDLHPVEANLNAIKKEVDKAREIAPNGIIGINIMVATKYYEEYVKKAVEAKVDLIICGAGLPMDLPSFVKNTDVKIAPIVSSKKAASIIVRQWERKYEKFPDLVVIEGPLAGGHLGFQKDILDEFIKSPSDYDKEVIEIIEYIREVEKKNNITIPVVVGGGVFCVEDMKHYMDLGADGVQVGTRFVTTYECDASMEYKQAYINAKEDDVVIIKSPVGMPARAIKNEFLETVQSGNRLMGKCRQCVKTCDINTTPYCIAKALIEAVKGNLKEGLIFCGSNVSKITKMESVSEVMEEFASWQ